MKRRKKGSRSDLNLVTPPPLSLQIKYPSIASPQGMATLHTGVAEMKNMSARYAMGWAVGTLDGETMLMHNGDTSHFHSMVLLLPDRALGIVMLANASGFEQLTLMQVDQIAYSVARTLIHEAQPKPVSLQIGMRLFYWDTLLLPLLLVAGIVYGVMRWHGGTALAPWPVFAMVAAYLAIGAVSLFTIPGVIPFSLSSMRVFFRKWRMPWWQTGFSGSAGASPASILCCCSASRSSKGPPTGHLQETRNGRAIK